MTGLQAYIIISTGIVAGLCVILLGGIKLKNFAISFFRIAIIVRICLTCLTLVLLPFTGNETVKKVAFSEVGRVIAFFLSGIMLVFCFTWLAIPRQGKIMQALVKPYQSKLFNLFCWSLGFNFILAAISKIIFPQFITGFFTLSDYSVQFLYFIIGVETVCGLAMFIKKLVLPASAILIIDMAGATFTHYHNYFAKGIPDAFENSIPSLTLQPFLITVLILSMAYWQRKSKAANDAAAILQTTSSPT